MVRVKIGNILNCNEDIIVHQVNCQGIMGGGLARQLADQYPKLEEDYRYYCNYNNFDYKKLKGSIWSYIGDDYKAIINIFSQKPNFDTDYEALRKCLEQVKRDARELKASIAIPYGIGCGIANGDWNIVYKIIEEVFNGYNVTLYKLED